MMSDQADRPVSDAENPSRVEEQAVAYGRSHDQAAAVVQSTRRLEKADFSRPQANAVVLAVRELAGDLATKDDIARLDAEIATLATKEDIAELKTDIARLEAAGKNDITELRTEFKSDVAELRTDIARLEARFDAEIPAIKDTMATKGDLKTEIAQVETRLRGNANRNTLWLTGMLFVAVGLLFTMLRFFPPNLTP